MGRGIKQIIKDCVPYGIMKKRIPGPDSLPHPVYVEGKTALTPEIYANNGKRMKMFYLQDALSAHTPYTLVEGRYPKEILWDRFNYGLKEHFYGHHDIFINKPHFQKKYGFLTESEVIVKSCFDRVMNSPEEIGEYDCIFTHSARVLDRYSNALFVPANGIWYGTVFNGGTFDEEAYLKKTKNISMISSNKAMCEYHKLRLDWARTFEHSDKVDTYGSFNGNYIEKKADTLTDYRYQIVVENDVTPYYFTEKILDCFASMTVPIYVGATKISEFFDADGIIIVKPEEYDKIEEIISKCSSEDYEMRVEAIKRNYELCQKYMCVEDYLMENYREKFL